MILFRRIIRSLSQIPDSPERTALAFSVGIFLGFSPFLGLHTLFGLLTAFLFRLNKFALFAGVWLNAPWIIVPYYGFATWLGVLLLGVPYGTSIPSVSLSDLFSSTFWAWVASQWRLLVPAFVGSSVLCFIMSVVAYPIALWTIRGYARHFDNRTRANLVSGTFDSPPRNETKHKAGNGGLRSETGDRSES